MKLYSDEELAEILDQEIFHLISDVADHMKFECYVVGGYVRDIFLERPSDDIDVVVVGSGIEVAQALKKKLGHKAHLSVFRNFGTAQVKIAPSNLPPLGEAKNESFESIVASVTNRYMSSDPHEYGLLKEFAKEHRKYQTEAESILWNALRGKQLGAKFRRQHAIGDFIVDFACLSHSLVIEVDGKYHFSPDQQKADELRTKILKDLGFVELRFTNDEIIADIDHVLAVIKRYVASPNGGRLEGAIEVEFVGARKESYSHDSRKPIVEDGTLEDDQNRRDFTINAMAICLNKARFGELVDPFNGLADLEDGIIATPLDPEITFSDDPLRMLRCIRFATQLNFQIEDETFRALERMADRIKIISAERIGVEMNKIMMAQHPSIGLEYLQRSGLLQIILPELAALDIVEKKNGRAHKNNFYHTLEVLENVVKSGGALWLRWAALLHDVGKTKTKRWDPAVGWTFHNHNFVGAKMVPQIFRRMALPLDAKMKYVQKLVDLHMRPIAIADEEVTDSAVRRLLNDAGEDIDDLMILCEADITSKNEVRKKIFLENFRMVREKLADLKEKDYKRLLQPVIDGNEIMELFHLQPSREVGILKQTLKDAVLDNKVPNEREPLMELLMEKAKKMGLV